MVKKYVFRIVPWDHSGVLKPMLKPMYVAYFVAIVRPFDI